MTNQTHWKATVGFSSVQVFSSRFGL